MEPEKCKKNGAFPPISHADGMAILGLQQEMAIAF